MPKNKTTKTLMIKGIQLYIEIEKDEDGTWIGISSDGYKSELIQPIIDHLKLLQNEDDLEYETYCNSRFP